MNLKNTLSKREASPKTNTTLPNSIYIKSEQVKLIHGERNGWREQEKGGIPRDFLANDSP